MRFRQFFEENAPIDDLRAKLMAKYPGLYLFVSENNYRIEISSINVPEEQRNKGIGSAVLKAIQDYAHSVNKPIVLSPEPEPRKKVALNRFYKTNGFVHNKGKNRDYRLSSMGGPTMLWRPRFKEFVENGMYFHGSHQPINQFSYTFLGSGKGYNQEGPGFYFTSDDSDAKVYGQHLFHANIQLKKPVPLTGSTKRKEIELMLKNAPDLEETLTDWDENPKIALKKAIDSIINYNSSPHGAFQSVWYDFYRGSEQQYLHNMKALLGYDGVMIPRGNIQHIIVFDPNDIKRV